MDSPQINEKGFSIGQVVYILSNKSQKIVPGMIIEEAIVKKLDGNHISWKIAVGPAGKEKVIDHAKLDGDIFTSLSDIEAVMRKRLESFLADLLNEAKSRAVAWYPQKTSTGISSSFKEEVDTNKVDPDTLYINSVTENVQTNQHAIVHNPMRDALRKVVDEESQQLQPGVIGSEILVLDNGQHVKFNIKAQ